MRSLLLIAAVVLASALSGQSNEVERKRLEWEIYQQKLKESEGDKYAAARIKEIEAKREADKKKKRGIDWFPVVMFGVPIGGVVILVVALIWKARTPLVHCPRCHWSGKEADTSRLGMQTTDTEFAAGQIGDLFAPGTSVAMEIGKSFTGPTCCPRCGASPLIDNKDMPPPPPPRTAVRKLPDHLDRR